MNEDTPSTNEQASAKQGTQPIVLKNHRDAKRQATAKGKTLCKRGFHKWEVNKKNQFDTKAGKLVTAYACARCGATRTKGT